MWLYLICTRKKQQKSWCYIFCSWFGSKQNRHKENPVPVSRAGLDRRDGRCQCSWEAEFEKILRGSRWTWNTSWQLSVFKGVSVGRLIRELTCVYIIYIYNIFFISSMLNRYLGDAFGRWCFLQLYLGKMIQFNFDLYFFKWFGSTTNFRKMFRTDAQTCCSWMSWNQLGSWDHVFGVW